MLARVEENMVSSHGFISDNFTISDGALASLVNCVLELDADEPVDAGFIKHFR